MQKKTARKLRPLPTILTTFSHGLIAQNQTVFPEPFLLNITLNISSFVPQWTQPAQHRTPS